MVEIERSRNTPNSASVMAFNCARSRLTKTVSITCPMTAGKIKLIPALSSSAIKATISRRQYGRR
ncbi:MAG: hypothetical protein UZ13_02109 [Chloroflexi bacterium OLB13]|nr:MAG: hypothetical protein UZ13_02109 [Chloroflexi bacterium OLB13]